ncbi:hypothetical protein V8E36_008807 [Tilletia maclaganii]
MCASGIHIQPQLRPILRTTERLYRKGISAYCSDSSQCGSQFCTGGSAGNNGYCAVSNSGQVCASFLDCRGFTVCTDQRRCTMKPDDTGCVNGSDCSSGVCSSGRCTRLESGSRCESDSNCRVGYCASDDSTRFCGTGNGCLIYGICTLKNQLGAYCELNQDCAYPGTVCVAYGPNKGTCQYPPPQRRRPVGGQSCYGDFGCASGSCNLPSGASTGTCRLSSSGGRCETKLDCQSLSCTYGRCDAAAGESCTAAYNCASNLCCNGKCMPSLAGTPCNVGSSCSSGNCDPYSGQYITTAQHYYRVGTCTSGGNAGALCQSNDSCYTGSCQAVTFSGTFRNKVSVCTAGPGYPPPPLTCSNPPRAAGFGCYSSYDCVTGKCSSDGRQVSRRSSPTGLSARFDDGVCEKAIAGSNCYTSDDCDGPTFCDDTLTCRLRRSSETCTSNDQCETSYCNPSTGTCTLDHGSGESCASSDDCVSPYLCDTSALLCRLRRSSEPCDFDAQCDTNYCNPTTQKFSLNHGLGESCTSSDDCSDGGCLDNGTCGQLAIGQACSSERQCRSRVCGTQNGSNSTTTCQPGQPVYGLGSEFQDDSECYSGACPQPTDQSSRVCVTASGGSSCIANEFCTTKRCVKAGPGADTGTCAQNYASGFCKHYRHPHEQQALVNLINLNHLHDNYQQQALHEDDLFDDNNQVLVDCKLYVDHFDNYQLKVFHSVLKLQHEISDFHELVHAIQFQQQADDFPDHPHHDSDHFIQLQYQVDTYNHFDFYNQQTFDLAIVFKHSIDDFLEHQQEASVLVLVND